MKNILCLLYHRVNPIKDDVYHLAVSPEHFEEQIRYLKEYFPILRFEEDWKLPGDKGVVITFDDGYGDNYDYALPILERYQIPATVFVCTGYVGLGREYWWDDMARLLTQDVEYPKQFRLEDTLYSYTWDTDSLEKRIDMIKSLHWILKMNFDIARAEWWLEQLRRWAGLGRGGRKDYLPMDMEQLKKMGSSQYITIGAHTVNHRSLGAQNRKSQEYEIGTSICCLKKILCREIQVFSYPFGSLVHFNQDTFEICKEKGIVKAASTVRGLWNEESNPYAISRMEVGDWDRYEFKKFVEDCWRW